MKENDLMPDTFPPSQPRSNARYRRVTPFSIAQGIPTSTYIATATGFCLAMGVAFLVTPGSAAKDAAPQVSESLGTYTTGLNALPAVYTGPAPSLLSKVDSKQPKATEAPVLKLASQESVAKPAPKKHLLQKLWPWKKGAAKRKDYVAAKPAAPVDPPTSLDLATAAAADGPFFVSVEGDVKIASYDETSGAIQTYEGSNFILAKASSPETAIPWDDYPFNVHYRCDEMGTCTLMRGSGTAIAKLTR
jgi:hypothetical protein